MLNTVAIIDNSVCASFRTKFAVPNDAGLGPPPAPGLRVGTAGGTSWEFVRIAYRIVAAPAWGAQARIRETRRSERSRTIVSASFEPRVKSLSPFERTRTSGGVQQKFPGFETSFERTQALDA
jgi:hypothetical protein